MSNPRTNLTLVLDPWSLRTRGCDKMGLNSKNHRCASKGTLAHYTQKHNAKIMCLQVNRFLTGSWNSWWAALSNK